MQSLQAIHQPKKRTNPDMSQTAFSTFFKTDDQDLPVLTPFGAALIHQSMNATPKLRQAAVSEVQALSKEIAAKWLAQKKANAEESGSAPKGKSDAPKKTIKKSAAGSSKKVN